MNDRINNRTEDSGFDDAPQRHSFLDAAFSVSRNVDETVRLRRQLNVILLVILSFTSLILILSYTPLSPIPATRPLFVLLLVELVAFAVFRSGRVGMAAGILSAGLFTFACYIAFLTGGIDSPAIFLLVTIAATAGLIWSGVAGVALGILGILAGSTMYVLEVTGLLPPPTIFTPPITYWVAATATIITVTAALYTTLGELKNSLTTALGNEDALIKRNQDLTNARVELEKQVAARTNDLEQRTKYLQASIEVSHIAASLMETEHLLQQTVELVREQFGLYYVGVFLSDPEKEWAILRAGTGAAGKAMIERGHRIRIGSGMIGWSIANAQPRVASNISADAVRLVASELPETRSEGAIPLRLGDEIMGAITVQSRQPDAFGELEVDTFLALADLIAVSLENSRLFSESQTALAEAQRAYGAASQTAWRQLLRSGEMKSYRYDHQTFASIQSDWQPEMRQAAQTGKSVVRMSDPGISPSTATLFLPIPVREQVLGVINLTRTGQTDQNIWAEDEIALLENLAEQMGLAIESARLYQDTRKSAIREQMTGDVTTRIRETLDIETVLRTAVQEIKKAMGSPEVVISLKAPASAPSRELDGNGR